MTRFDIAIIGAGMAGASLAAEIAGRASVLLLEAEPHPGYHSTGRSAAFWSESYGGAIVQPLTTASGPFLRDPPAAFHDRPFLRPRGALHIARDDGAAALTAMVESFAESTVYLERVDGGRLQAIVQGLRPGWHEGVYEPSCADIDVGSLHAAYLAQARRCGAELVTDARLASASRSATGWTLETSRGQFQAAIIVDAAGAWADDVALAAGMRPIGIQAYRRTIAQLRVSPPATPDLPLVIDALGRFYFKPEAGGRLWLSPHDETACPPCDAAAEELDVALAIDRLQQVVDWEIEAVEHKWAGLRSFAPDRLPVIGFERGRDDFFWFAGQGGFGIQTAPAAAKLAAGLLLGGEEEDPLVAGIDPAPYRAERFTN